MINTKDELFRTICNASKLGMLGFFIGAGFSKALLWRNERYKALSWGDLLRVCCEKLNVNKDILKSYSSYPEVATKICKEYSRTNEIGYEDAVKEFKLKVCECVNTYPERDRRERYMNWFECLKPSWITTTNYDTLIESVLGGNALPISPNGCFCNVRGMIPVFHIHGICNEPDDIIITNEDYTYMFRPNDYRQARLPFLMKESCVLMIGYALGDINVVTAVDWANNVYVNTNDSYDFPTIQLLYTDNPRPDPYSINDNTVIYEINNLDSFFEEICTFMHGYDEKYQAKQEKVENLIKYFNDAEEKNIQDFIDDTDEWRSQMLKFFKALEPEFGYVYNSFFQFVYIVLAKLNERSRANGAFDAYDYKLRLILDIFVSIPVNRIPPSFFGMLADQLDNVGYYLNTEGRYVRGESYAATDSWQEYKGKLPQKVIDELWRFCISNKAEYNRLPQLLKSI